MKSKRIQDPYLLKLVEMLVGNFHRVHLAYGDGHSPRRRDQVLVTRAQKAEGAANELGTVVKWTAPMIGVSNARAVDKTPMLRTDVNIAASVLSAIAIANVAETAMETENGIRSIVSASGILNAIETDATVSGTEIGNEIAIETAKEVTAIDGTKRIAIVKAGRIVKLVVELFSPLRTVVSPPERVIVLLPPLRTSLGSEEDLPMMTYVFPLLRALLYFYSSRPVCLF